MEPKECLYCGKKFRPDDNNDSYCSEVCLNASIADDDDYDDEEYYE